MLYEIYASVGLNLYCVNEPGSNDARAQLMASNQTAVRCLSIQNALLRGNGPATIPQKIAQITLHLRNTFSAYRQILTNLQPGKDKCACKSQLTCPICYHRTLIRAIRHATLTFRTDKMVDGRCVSYG